MFVNTENITKKLNPILEKKDKEGRKRRREKERKKKMGEGREGRGNKGKYQGLQSISNQVRMHERKTGSLHIKMLKPAFCVARTMVDFYLLSSAGLAKILL